MRVVKPNPEKTAWELKGWNRPPRNQYEEKLLSRGEPEPPLPGDDLRLPVRYRQRKCRKCRGSNWKPVIQIGSKTGKFYETAYCFTCKLRGNKRYRKKHPKKAKKWQMDYDKKIKEMQPDFHDGVAVVSSLWVVRHQLDITEAVKDGKGFIVEYLGIPAYSIGRIS